jgi:predicted nuclease of predicted toxin-antitoxin system
VKLLFDQNLSHRLPDRLSDLFPASTQARLIGLDRASDAELWAYASRGGFAIVSRDVDLAEMATLRGAPPLVVWLRGGNSSPRQAWRQPCECGTQKFWRPSRTGRPLSRSGGEGAECGSRETPPRDLP